MADQALIEEASRRHAAAAAPGTRVILFGSYARGDAGGQSDLDFLIVEPTVDHPGEESVRLRRSLRGLGIAADVIVVSAQDADEWQDVRGSFVHAALSEGRELVG